LPDRGPRIAAISCNLATLLPFSTHSTTEFEMIKPLVIACLLTVAASAAGAQQADTAVRRGDPQIATVPAPSAAADARKLIGRSVKNTNDETIGQIESVYIAGSGKVDSVIVGVGGFLGVGERRVRLTWDDLQISNSGERVVLSASKDQLKAMAPYAYRETTLRGQVFDESSAQAPAATMPTGTMTVAATSDPRAIDQRPTESTGDFNASGEVSGNALLGAKVYDADDESIGTVDDVYVDSKGTIQSVVVSVGGFLGMMSKDVAVKWADLHYSHDGKSLRLTTAMTKDRLTAMPDYKYERRQPVRTGG
jgi:sporulation protein YlmC with PRC-barrel domain